MNLKKQSFHIFETGGSIFFKIDILLTNCGASLCMDLWRSSIPIVFTANTKYNDKSSDLIHMKKLLSGRCVFGTCIDLLQPMDSLEQPKLSSCKQINIKEVRPHSVSITEFGAVGDGSLSIQRRFRMPFST